MGQVTDFSNFDTSALANEGVEIELQDPRLNTGMGIFFTVLGQDSDAYRRRTLERSNARLRMGARAGRPAITAEELEEESLDLLSVCVKGWRLTKEAQEKYTFDGGPWPAFSPETAKALLKRFRFVRDQISAAVQDQSLFTKA